MKIDWNSHKVTHYTNAFIAGLACVLVIIIFATAAHISQHPKQEPAVIPTIQSQK